jgi:hypothetical protein
MNQNLVEYNLPKGAYASFDAVSLKDLIKDRLTTNSLFTDQNFEGSNLAALSDVFAFAYHILLFYYNQTASEAMFDQALLYENMNKIVKSISYKPIGPRTSIITFNVEASSDLALGSYTIKRYSFINYNGYAYSIAKDITFEKTLSGAESLTTVSDNNLIYQGKYFEYPDYVAIGEDYEVITIAVDNVDSKTFIDYDNVDVYVKDYATGGWSIYEEVTTLFLQAPNAKVFEKRVNESGRYEIKFGNNINGKKLNPNDTVSIFYLLSDGKPGEIDQNVLQRGSTIKFYNTSKFNEIYNYIYADSPQTFLNINSASTLEFSNPIKSTNYTDFETAAEIRSNAPAILASQNRAVTVGDYNAYINKEFNNIVQSFSVTNNDEYLSGYIRYFYDIGLVRPNDNSLILSNQINFSDACDFNNIYIFAVPKVAAILNETDPIPLSTAQKQAIVNRLNSIKMATNEIVMADPVYMAFDLGVEIITDQERSLEDIRENVQLEIEVSPFSKISKDQIKNIVNQIIIDFFKSQNNALGSVIDLAELTRSIISIDSINSINTVYTKNGLRYAAPGISFVVWNAQYPQDDINITTQTLSLPYYKFPFLFESSKLIRKIAIVSR